LQLIDWFFCYFSKYKSILLGNQAIYAKKQMKTLFRFAGREQYYIEIQSVKWWLIGWYIYVLRKTEF